MVTIDYKLSPSWNARMSEVALASADEMELRYDLLLGDIVLKVDGHDFSAKWHWVPIVDFATSLGQLPKELLSDNAIESILDFTESDATLRFKREGEVVIVSADYAPGEARVLLEEFNSAVDSFVRRVGRELCDQYPALRTNEAFRRFLPVAAS
jgi:hypothetical protein